MRKRGLDMSVWWNAKGKLSIRSAYHLLLLAQSQYYMLFDSLKRWPKNALTLDISPKMLLIFRHLLCFLSLPIYCPPAVSVLCKYYAMDTRNEKWELLARDAALVFISFHFTKPNSGTMDTMNFLCRPNLVFLPGRCIRAFVCFGIILELVGISCEFDMNN